MSQANDSLYMLVIIATDISQDWKRADYHVHGVRVRCMGSSIRLKYFASAFVACLRLSVEKGRIQRATFLP